MTVTRKSFTGLEPGTDTPVDRFSRNEIEWPQPPVESNPVIGKCPRCGLELRAAMMYSCAAQPCPAGLGSRGTL